MLSSFGRHVRGRLQVFRERDPAEEVQFPMAALEELFLYKQEYRPQGFVRGVHYPHFCLFLVMTCIDCDTEQDTSLGPWGGL